LTIYLGDAKGGVDSSLAMLSFGIYGQLIYQQFSAGCAALNFHLSKFKGYPGLL